MIAFSSPREPDSSPSPALSRPSSLIEHDAPSPTLDPLLLASLSVLSNNTDIPIQASPGSYESCTPWGDFSHPKTSTAARAKIVKPVVQRPTSLVGLSNARNTSTSNRSNSGRNNRRGSQSKLPLLRTGSNSSCSPSSSPSPSSPSASKLKHRHSFSAFGKEKSSSPSSPSSPSRIPVPTLLHSPHAVPNDAFIFPIVGAAAGRRMGKVRSQTLQFREKFVTELSIYDTVSVSIGEAWTAGEPPVNKATPAPAPPESSSTSVEVPNLSLPLDSEAELTNSALVSSPSSSSGRGSEEALHSNSAAPKERVMPQIPLGVYLSTERSTGCHFVYKVSPMSVLADMRLRVGDRLTRINDLSVETWSHNTVLEFIRSLSLNTGTSEADGNVHPHVDQSSSTSKTVLLSLTLRRAARQSRTPDAVAPEDRIEARLVMDLTGARLQGVQMREDRVHHSNSVLSRILAAGESNRALLIRGPAHAGASALTLGYTGTNRTDGCVRVHRYRIPPSLGSGGGQSVLLEAPSGGIFVSAVSGSSGPSHLGVMVSSAAPQSVTTVDARFFRIAPSDGERHFLIHMQTGKYISHGRGSLTLEEATPQLVASGGLEFEFFPCDE
ncbi:PDZ domain [Trinorchestia longiramus]|nr:PDZ domain [Trinorchestia longiramus]